VTENIAAVTAKCSVPRFAGRVSADPRLAETLGGVWVQDGMRVVLPLVDSMRLYPDEFCPTAKRERHPSNARDIRAW
jgi:hypothetical protein